MEMDVKLFYVIRGDEFNGDALSNAVASFFHIFVIVLLVEKLTTTFQPLNITPSLLKTKNLGWLAMLCHKFHLGFLKYLEGFFGK